MNRIVSSSLDIRQIGGTMEAAEDTEEAEMEKWKGHEERGVRVLVEARVPKEGARPPLHQCWSIVSGGFATSGTFVMLNELVNEVLFPKYLATEVLEWGENAARDKIRIIPRQCFELRLYMRCEQDGCTPDIVGTLGICEVCFLHLAVGTLFPLSNVCMEMCIRKKQWMCQYIILSVISKMMLA
ncbi:hypothetical protein Cgig2_001108 [Carnegiea gigantea]|uniref:Uncharacterized protein n=1 Tax=Carnegiea gigantea TaxID=171969 RepID=A0A9Q1JWS3_9CARY|nr:hypothetical protein Cgig2_001108 [Carnegiea gigantea]